MKHSIYKCPDGIDRTNPELAKLFGLTVAGWSSRACRHGFKTAWGMGKRERNVNRSKRVGLSETARQQQALDRIPSPTKQEKELWGI